MHQTFRFSPKQNRAALVEWRHWGAAALAEASAADRPVLLNLTASWCASCRELDETTFSDPSVAGFLNEHLVPVRVDVDWYPHVQDRYLAGGVPTNAFLTPTAEVLWAGQYLPADEFEAVARGVVAAWRDRRDELQLEIGRRRKALEAARARHPSVGLVRRSAADDVLAATREAYDERNGGFGDEPKFTYPDAIELLFVQGGRDGDPAWTAMAHQTLDCMRASALWDDVDGGFFHYAQSADWSNPRHEKLLDVNASLLRVYALGAHMERRDDWREVAERTVEWADRMLRLPGGLWAGSLASEREYYTAAPAARSKAPRPSLDDVVYTNANAQWIRALAEAGGRQGRADWIATSAAALETLLSDMAAPADALYHFRAPGSEPALPGLLADSVDAAGACVAVAQATGRAGFLAHACRLAAGMERSLCAEDGGFYDHARVGEVVGALRFRDRPFELNAAAARLFIDLALATGERSYRALAERVLALLSPLAGRFGVAGTGFALAVEEFFEPPIRLVITGAGDAAAQLRAAALALRAPDRRVWTLEKGGRIGSRSFSAGEDAAAYACGSRGCSAPVHEPDALEAAADSVRQTVPAGNARSGG